MKARRRTDGTVDDLSPEAARVLIDAGIYDAVDAGESVPVELTRAEPAPPEPRKRGRPRKNGY